MPRYRRDRHDPLPVFERTVAETLINPFGRSHMGRHHDADADGVADQPAETAGEQDHADPWVYAGGEADAPTDPEGDDDGVA